MHQAYDIAGIGFGPANIALAIALEELFAEKRALFFERQQGAVWQQEMLFENSLDIDSNIQNIPHRDLVTPRNPRSRYTFLNYLHENGRLFEHLNMDMLLPMRPEYADYLKWVSGFFKGIVKTGSTIQTIELVRLRSGQWHFKLVDQLGSRYFARHLVVATGREPYVPAVFQPVLGARVFHAASFNTSWRRLLCRKPQKVAVIGSSQSAVEIILYLSKTHTKLEIHSIIRRFGFPLKDTNPFMGEIFFPEFTDAYFDADEDLKQRIQRDVYRTNYGAADMDVLQELYRQIYYDKLLGQNHITLWRMMDVQQAGGDEKSIVLRIRNRVDGRVSAHRFDAVVLATGFRNIGPESGEVRVPQILAGMIQELDLDDRRCIQIERDYSVRLRPDIAPRPGLLFMNGLCERTHGMGDGGSLSLVSVRAERILSSAFREAQGADLPTAQHDIHAPGIAKAS